MSSAAILLSATLFFSLANKELKGFLPGARLMEFACLSSKTLETLGEMAEKRYGLVCYTLRVLFLGKAIASNAM